MIFFFIILVKDKNSITLNWRTTGNYPLSITAIEDQGLMNQVTKYSLILNQNPESKFTLGVEVPAAFSFSEDLIANITFMWNLKNVF